MAALADYVRQAEANGGLRHYWEAAWGELPPAHLGKLAEALRQIAPRRRGGDGRVVEQRFALSRSETAALIERLLAAGIADATICRYAGVSQAVVGAIRQDGVMDPPNPGDSAPAPRASSRDRNGKPTNTSTGAPQRCEWCSEQLPSTLRADAHYCPGGACRKAANRAKQGRGA